MSIEDVASSVVPLTRRLLIDGCLVETEQTFTSLNPATGEPVGAAPDAGTYEAGAAIAAARRAFDETDWSTDTALRIRCLEQLHQALCEHADELRALLVAEVGSSLQLTYGPQLDEPIDLPRYYAELLRTHPMTEDLGEIDYQGQRHRRWVEKEAAGVVTAIVPFNFPIQLALAKIAPALAAGCTVVLKGSPDAPLSTLALGELVIAHTDIPAGVLNVITSSDTAVAESLTTHSDVDVVSFTGSTPVGRKISAAAGDTVKRVFLELGGKSALIMLDDADPRGVAMHAAFGVCLQAGQACAINSRLLVPRAQHDEMAERVAKYLGKVGVGDPSESATFMGPLINERQRDLVDGMVRRAVADGATLVRGGERSGPGFFYAPTLLAGVDPDSEIAQHEVFGPVLALIPYDDEDHAVRIANNSRYGLSGAVHSADEQRALAVARRVRTGTFSINGGNYFASDAPFGGYKQSGIGREKGVAGFEEFLERKTFGSIVA